MYTHMELWALTRLLMPTNVVLANRNKIDLQNKYCYRQAELGIGDCGGLRVSLLQQYCEALCLECYHSPNLVFGTLALHAYSFLSDRTVLSLSCQLLTQTGMSAT